MIRLAFLFFIILAVGALAIGVYYVLYARTINKRIREGKNSGKKLLDIPRTVSLVVIALLIFYTVIVSFDYRQYRHAIENQRQNRNNIARVDLSDYSYCGYTGNIVLEDASFLKAYSKEKNDGYKKTVSKEGNVNDGQSVRISLGTFGMNAKQEIAQIEEEAMKSDTDKMPDYLDYAKERGSVTVVVD